MLIDVVRQLGAEADERWAREDYALEAFAPIAADAIGRFSFTTGSTSPSLLIG